MSSFVERCLLAWALMAAPLAAEDLGETWGTAKREREYYRVVQLPIPEGLVVEAGAFLSALTVGAVLYVAHRSDGTARAAGESTAPG